MQLVGNEEHHGEENADDPGARLDFLDLAGKELDQDVGDQAEGDAVGDVVGKRHNRHGEERGNRRGRIAPLDVLDAADHEDADIDQRGSRRTGRNQARDRREEHGDEEHHSAGDGGQAGTAAFRNTGGGFDEGGDGGGAANCAEAGRNSVRQHCLFHTGNIAVLVEQTADGAGAEQRAEGIEHIDHAEGKHGADEGEDKAAHTVGCDPCGEVKALGKHGAEADVEEVLERRDRVEGQACCKAVIEAGNSEAEEVVKNGTADDAPEHSALDLLLGQRADDNNGEDGNDQRHDLAPGDIAEHDVERVQVNQGCAVIDDKTDILHADKGDEQTDAGCDGALNRLGNGFEDELAETGDGQENEDEAVNKDHDQSVLIGEAQTEANGVNEECIQTHAGGLRKGKSCQKADEQGAEHGGDCGCDVNRVVHRAGLAVKVAEHAGVDHQDVRHCHECGDTGYNFGTHRGLVFL